MNVSTRNLNPETEKKKKKEEEVVREEVAGLSDSYLRNKMKLPKRI